MRCPFCGEDEDKVNDSRQSKDGREIRRRRECLRCSRRFTTYERIEESMPMVIKRDGRREAFDRAKIERGLQHAVAKLPVSQEAVRRLAEDVEREIGELGLEEIPARAVGEGAAPAVDDHAADDGVGRGPAAALPGQLQAARQVASVDVRRRRRRRPHPPSSS